MPPLFGFLTVFLALFGSVTSDYRPECMDVVDNFAWCTGFIENVYDYPSPRCCDSLKNLNAIAKHEKGGARRICGCIEDMAKEVHPSYNETRIKDLYSMCHVHLSFPISERMDCSKVDYETGIPGSSLS
ncbi:unnamed protein product [Ilex paraguariensis]|uniref:Bifunctional inhibitor/plant lipid transfer protein/seed storage helical domain-containing protein n=1 Tax=Ilex paraguariensis TaxID=185542 RepID=A0ABC8SCA7_9AQUA